VLQCGRAELPVCGVQICYLLFTMLGDGGEGDSDYCVSQGLLEESSEPYETGASLLDEIVRDGTGLLTSPALGLVIALLGLHALAVRAK
jgi:hypothetical protein